jgi:hypothetical protein
MFSEQWPRALAASVAPVVIISATALLCLAFYNRLAAIVGRLRAVQRERLAMNERIAALSPHEIERAEALRHTCVLENLAEQSARILRRAHLIRATLLCFLGTIAALILSSLLNGLTAVWAGGVLAVALCFIVGMLLLLGGIICAAAELLIALSPAELESDVVDELTGERRPHENEIAHPSIKS